MHAQILEKKMIALGINRDLRLNSNSKISIYSEQTFRGNKYTQLHLQ